MVNELAACWPDPVLCQDCCSEEVSGLDAEVWQIQQANAVDFLWRATGKQYGVCENTYRPCRRTCNGTAWGWPIGSPFIPWRINDQWVNLSCSSCPGECGCGGAVSEIRLSSIEAVTGVRIDGVDLIPEDVVAVYDRHRIVRIDGEQWPGCQNLSSKDGVGTWSVTVQQGVPVPAGGDLIAGILACEYAKACLNSKDCRLPRNVQSLVRQGVTMEMILPDIGEMLTGIYEVDSWILKGRETRWQAPSILSPDRRPAARMTWPVVEA